MNNYRKTKQANIWHESEDVATLTIDGARLTAYFHGTNHLDAEVFGYSVEIGAITYKGSAETLEQGKRRAMNQYKHHVKLSPTKSGN